LELWLNSTGNDGQAITFLELVWTYQVEPYLVFIHWIKTKYLNRWK
jgi:hypothetical protein